LLNVAAEATTRVANGRVRDFLTFCLALTPEGEWSGLVSRPDQLRFQKQIHDEAELLRVVAHEADLEMAAIGAATRRKRELERLRRERQAARSTKRGGERGEGGRGGVEPNPIQPTDPERDRPPGS
jgi:hypothetical protein